MSDAEAWADEGNNHRVTTNLGTLVLKGNREFENYEDAIVEETGQLVSVQSADTSRVNKQFIDYISHIVDLLKDCDSPNLPRYLGWHYEVTQQRFWVILERVTQV
jgi:hypothetical protein